ncbi:MAG: hypothetical protein IJT65_03230 [Eubacterium sp.]|nr:hypothetical protein [Eubacterium sp.]
MIKKKITEDLLEELKQENTDIKEYITENSNSFIQVNLREFWNGLFEKSGKTKADVVNNSDVSYIYFYEILQGKKVPTKDKIVRLILAMGLELEDCQKALKYCNQSLLYPRIKRDSYIIYAIEHKISVYKTQEMLIEAGEPELK